MAGSMNGAGWGLVAGILALLCLLVGLVGFLFLVIDRAPVDAATPSDRPWDRFNDCNDL